MVLISFLCATWEKMTDSWIEINLTVVVQQWKLFKLSHGEYIPYFLKNFRTCLSAIIREWKLWGLLFYILKLETSQWNYQTL